MLHLYLLLLIFSLMLAILTAGIYIFLYQKYKLVLIKDYLYNQGATVLLVFFTALNFYLYLNVGIFDNMIKVMFAHTANVLLFSSPTLYTTPIFIRELCEKGNPKKIKIFFGFVATLSALISLLIFKLGYLEVLHNLNEDYTGKLGLLVLIWLGILLLFTSLSYSFGILFHSYRKIADPYRKRGALYLIVYSLFAILLAYFDFTAQTGQMAVQQFPVGIFLQPLLLILYSVLSLLYLWKTREESKNNKGNLSRAFVMKYKITDREIEIIEMLSLGLSNKEIASKLFLSPSTVRNHISNIFEKTEMSSRGKLLNLIKKISV